MILRYQWSYRAISPAIKCHGRDNWIRLLTTVLLCPRSTIRDEIVDSPSEMVYGTNGRLLGEIFENYDSFFESPINDGLMNGIYIQCQNR